MIKFLGRFSKKSDNKRSHSDIEDEGFVLVGETPSERLSKSCTSRDAPPSYSTQIGKNMGANQSNPEGQDDPLRNNAGAVSSAADYLTLTQDHFARPPAGVNQPVPESNLPYQLSTKTNASVQQCAPVANQVQEPQAPKTVYEDIPFKLSPVLEMNVRNGIQVSNIPLQRPNIAAYYYDFSLERSTLKDAR